MKSLRSIEWGVAFKAMEGQNVLGDKHLVKFFNGGALIAVVDGLGHGQEAAEAANEAVKILDDHSDEPVISLINRCHLNLKNTRGATMTLLSFHGLGEGNGNRTTADWLAVGNVSGFLIRANKNTSPRMEGVLLNAGIVGHELSGPLNATRISIAHNDLLVLATDGIQTAFTEGLAWNDYLPKPQQMANELLSKYRIPTDDALACVIHYIEKRE